MNTEFYHVAPIALEAGSVIRPGSWGKNLRNYQIACNALYYHRNLVWDMIFENIRLLHAPNKPSRLKSCFAFPDYQSANNLKNKQGGFIHKVQFLCESKELYETDFSLYLYQLDIHQIQISIYTHIEDAALRYWKIKPHGIQLREVFAETSLKIIECLEGYPMVDAAIS